MREGLYKTEFHTVHGTGTGVLYATSGKLRGGNSAFAFSGTYTGSGDAILVKISTQRHNDDPAFKPLFGTDMITLHAEGQGRTATWSTSKARRCNYPASPSGRC